MVQAHQSACTRSSRVDNQIACVLGRRWLLVRPTGHPAPQKFGRCGPEKS